MNEHFARWRTARQDKYRATWVSLTAKINSTSTNAIIRRLRPVVNAAGIAALVVLALVVVLYQRVEARSTIDRAQRADAIIVLGSAVYRDERPSPSLSARIRRGIELYRAGYAPRIILSGGLGSNPPSEAEAMRRLALAAGVPAGALVLEDSSHSTEENLANAKAIMDARGWRTALIVSAPYHLLRAEIIAQDLGMDAKGSPAVQDPTFSAAPLHVWYTLRESFALVWYYATRVIGEPSWLHAILKGKI